MKRILIITSVVALVASAGACSGSDASAAKTARMTAGSHARTDDDITLWVKEALSLDPRISDPDGIVVHTENGIVKLVGMADNLLGRRYAALEAEKIAGVRGVINEVTLSPVDRPDPEIRSDIVRRLSGRPAVHVEDLEVRVVDGNATLKGRVGSLGELKHAEAIASEVRGVREITDLLEVVYQTPIGDADNREHIVAALNEDPYLTGVPITVRVEDGVAILDGTVGNFYERRRAEENVYRVASVYRLENNLKTDWLQSRGVRDRSPLPSDDDIREAVRDSLAQDLRIIRPTGIRVTVRDRVVTLEGTVTDFFQQTAIESDARDVVGVDEIIDLIQVEPGYRDSELIASELRLDLLSDYLLADRDVTVVVHDGVVTLTGTVETPYEKEHAETLARRVLGVRSVANELRLPGDVAYNDTALVDRVKARLRSNWKTRDVAERIHVEVEDGTATLSGWVNTWSERFEAARAAEAIDGVRDVRNRLIVEYPSWKEEER